MIVNEVWIKRQVDNLRKNQEYSITIDSTKVAKCLIAALVRTNIDFRLINCGGGVKKITNQVDTCPKCRGTGKC